MAGLLMLMASTAQSEWPVPFPFQIRQAGSSYLGVALGDIDSSRAKSLKLDELIGVEITFVEPGAAADHAGIQPGDVILSYNGEKVLGAQQLIRLVAETPQGRKVRLACWRNGERKDIWITTGAPPAASADLYISSSIRIDDVPLTMMAWRNLMLGIESESLSEQFAQSVGVKQGILVWTVADGSPAQRAGVRAGDVLTGFCGRSIHSPRELGMALQQVQNPQKPMSINLVRDHKAMSLTVSLEGER